MTQKHWTFPAITVAIRTGLTLFLMIGGPVICRLPAAEERTDSQAEPSAISSTATENPQAQRLNTEFRRLPLRTRLQLAALEPVQDELGLDSLTRRLAIAFRKRIRQEHQLMLGKGRHDPSLRFSHLVARLAALERAAESEFAKRLSQAQHQRLDEIFLQINGPLALLDNTLSQRIGLTNSQRDQFLTLLDEQRVEQRNHREQHNERSDDHPPRERQSERQENVEQFLAVLNETQRERYHEMQGKSFTLDLRNKTDRRSAQDESKDSLQESE